jgi:hypothetical protein
MTDYSRLSMPITFVRKDDVDVAGKTMFGMGMVQV